MAAVSQSGNRVVVVLLHSNKGEETHQNIAYIHSMLGQLRLVAQTEGADMLTYLIDMAYLEAGDLQAGRCPLSQVRQSKPEPRS